MRRIWITLGAALSLCALGASGALLGACAADPALRGAPASAHNAERGDLVAQGPTEDEDVFVLRIDAGRTAVFNEKISEALEGLTSPYAPRQSESILAVRARDLRETTAAVRAETYNFLRLEADACAQGKFTDISCAGGPPPAWLAQRPDEEVPAAEVRRRLEDLHARMEKLLGVACEEGKRTTKDEMYCSVE